MPIKITPEDYYETFTLGNYNDFIDNPYCIRRAFNAAISASHLADCFYSFNKKNNPDKVIDYNSLSEFMDHINHCTDQLFKDIRSIANAYKHTYTGSELKHSRHSSITSAGSIESIVMVNEEVELISEEFDKKNPLIRTVIYTRRSGDQAIFIKALDCVIRFWKDIF